jgi:hypothetical protein
MWEQVYIPSCEQSNALSATKDKAVNRADMAEFYAGCIIADVLAERSGGTRVDFKIVNQAVLERWPKGLDHIKNSAHKIAAERCKLGIE